MSEREQIKSDKMAKLNWAISTLEIISTENFEKKTLLQVKITEFRRDICKCKTVEEVDKMAYDVIRIMNDFITYRY